MKRTIMAVVTTLVAHICLAEETVIRNGWLPGAEMSQEIYYSTTQADYLKTRDSLLQRLKDGDFSAAQNTPEMPYMRVETTAVIGIEYSGVGGQKGKKHQRQVTASEDAVYLYEQWKKEQQ